MEVLYPRCCGLDVHKKTVVACAITPEGKEIHTFKTMTSDLLELADWIDAKKITHVAMESTGVYWHPIYNILETLDLTLLVMNAQHIKAVSGRKTDVKDAEWIADLLRHGLVVGSFIPNRPHRELRELVRYRRGLIRQRARYAEPGSLATTANLQLYSRRNFSKTPFASSLVRAPANLNSLVSLS